MEEEPSSAAGVSGNSATVRPNLQRYALRSAAKSKPDAPNRSVSPQSKRYELSQRDMKAHYISIKEEIRSFFISKGRSVSRSVGVLEFSGKDRSSSAKPPRRLSIPTKGSTTPSPKMAGSITPISETRTRRSGNGQGPPSRSQTPVSEIFRTSGRMKFNLISSASYWLNQIKLSESAAKHSISLGFFKLALEAGCEPFLKLQDELKSYVRRHQLAELGEPLKELLESYNIAENIVQTQVSESISQVPEEETHSSDDEVHCYSSSTMADEKLKPKCLDTDSTQLTPAATESTKKEACQKSNASSRLRESLRMNSANSRLASDRVNRWATKKLEKTNKQGTNKEKGEVKKKGKNSEIKEVLFSPTSAEDKVQGNKENMAFETSDEVDSTEVV